MKDYKRGVVAALAVGVIGLAGLASFNAKSQTSSEISAQVLPQGKAYRITTRPIYEDSVVGTLALVTDSGDVLLRYDPGSSSSRLLVSGYIAGSQTKEDVTTYETFSDTNIQKNFFVPPSGSGVANPTTWTLNIDSTGTMTVNFDGTDYFSVDLPGSVIDVELRGTMGNTKLQIRTTDAGKYLINDFSPPIRAVFNVDYGSASVKGGVKLMAGTGSTTPENMRFAVTGTLMEIKGGNFANVAGSIFTTDSATGYKTTTFASLDARPKVWVMEIDVSGRVKLYLGDDEASAVLQANVGRLKDYDRFITFGEFAVSDFSFADNE